MTVSNLWMLLLVPAMLILGLALIGVDVLIEALRNRPRERSPMELADQHIAEIGRNAQEAIVVEALRRMRERHRSR